MIAGVEVVRNPAMPLFDADDVSVSPLWTAPDPSAAPTADRPLWEGPAVVEVGGGTAYVLDRMARRVHALRAADGRWRATIGRPGGGPGEFERPGGIAVLGDTLIVLDGGEAALELLDPTGRYLRSIHLNAIGFDVHALAPDGLLVHLFSGGEDPGWTVIRPDGTRRSFTFPAPVTSDPDPSAGCSRTATAGRRLLRTSCATPRFQVVDAAGTARLEVLVDRPARETEKAVLEAHLRRVRETLARSGLSALTETQVAQERERLRFVLSMRKVLYDPATHCYALWEQTPDDLGGGNATLHLFSADGIYLAEVRFDREWVDFDVAGGTAFALVRDPETDLARLEAYRITLPEAAAPRGGD